MLPLLTYLAVGESKNPKINPIRGPTVDSSQLTFLPTSKSCDTKKLGRISKIRPNQIWILCPSLRMHGQLPAPVVNGVEIALNRKWKDFQLWRARDLDLGSGHTAYCRASLTDLNLHAKFHWNGRNFLWMDGRTYVRTHARTQSPSKNQKTA